MWLLLWLLPLTALLLEPVIKPMKCVLIKWKKHTSFSVLYSLSVKTLGSAALLTLQCLSLSEEAKFVQPSANAAGYSTSTLKKKMNKRGWSIIIAPTMRQPRIILVRVDCPQPKHLFLLHSFCCIPFLSRSCAVEHSSFHILKNWRSGKKAKEE